MVVASYLPFFESLIVADFGDAPDPNPGVGTNNYRTRLNGDGPRHLLVGGPRLGFSVDDETDGQPNAMATGDGGDENGVYRLRNPHECISIEFTLSGPLSHWADSDCVFHDLRLPGVLRDCEPA